MEILMKNALSKWSIASVAALFALSVTGSAEAKKTASVEPAPALPAPAATDKDKEVETGKTRAKEVSGKELDKAATEAKIGKLDRQVTDLDKALKASAAAPAEAAPLSRKARLAAEAAEAATGSKKSPTTVPVADPQAAPAKATDPKSAPAEAKAAPAKPAEEAAPLTRKQRLAAEAAAAAATK